MGSHPSLIGPRDVPDLKVPLVEVLAGGPALEAVVEFIGSSALPDSFLPVCRQWFMAGICHPCSFQAPVQAWRKGVCHQLDEQFAKMHEPPIDDDILDLRVGLEHAEEELRLTELSASFPAGVTVVLLRYARRLGALLHWVNIGRGQPKVQSQASCGIGCAALCGRKDCSDAGAVACLLQRRFLQQEALELRRRVSLLTDAMRELRIRLPDPEMPMRWAQWFEEAGEVAGLPVSHCARYRSQREQVASVWANNRRTFLSTDEFVDALAQSVAELEDDSENDDDCAWL